MRSNTTCKDCWFLRIHKVSWKWAYLTKRDLRFWIFYGVPLQIIIMSLTYKICEGRKIFIVPLIRSSFSSLTNIVMLMLITSSAKQKTREKGSPWLIDTKRFVDSMIIWIQLQNVLLKPKALMTLRRKFQSRVSKTLAMSFFNANLPSNVFLWRTLISSNVKLMQSLMFLPLVKPHSWIKVISYVICANLCGIIF